MDALSLLTQLEQHPDWEVVKIRDGIFIGDRDQVAEFIEMLELEGEDENGTEDYAEFG